MGKFKEQFEQAVKELDSKVKNRNQSIATKIQEIDKEVLTIEAEIKQLRQQIVDNELTGDTGAVEITKVRIGKLKTEMAELDEQKEAYNQVLSNGDYVKEIERIRVLAKEAYSERYAEIDKLRADIVQCDKQVRELELKRDEFSFQIDIIRSSKECETLRPIIDLIDKRLKQLDYGKRENWLEAWSEGKDLPIEDQSARNEPQRVTCGQEFYVPKEKPLNKVSVISDGKNTTTKVNM